MISSAACVGKRGSKAGLRVGMTGKGSQPTRETVLVCEQRGLRRETPKTAEQRHSPGLSQGDASSELRATVNHHSSAEGRSISSASNRGGPDPHCIETRSPGI